MRFRLLIIPVTALCLAGTAFGSPDEVEPEIPQLPPVKVRLTAFGSPTRLNLTAAGGLQVTNGETGEPVELTDGAFAMTASGRQVELGGQRAASFRVVADTVAVEANRVKRVYPGALVVTANAGKLSLVNECDLDRYTEGVLCGECPSLFHPEAIKAMAVAARSYSYRKAYLAKGDLCDTTHCQVYKGVGSVAPSLKAAVEATRGVCAVYDGQVIDAVYSSDCGGYTEANENAWKGARPVPYLRPVEDAPEPAAEPYCAVNRSHHWRVLLSPVRLGNLFGKLLPKLRLQVADTTESGRVRSLRLGPFTFGGDEAPEAAATPMTSMFKLPSLTNNPLLKTFTGEQWRKMLGLSVVKSLKFEIRESEKGVELAGRGYGHGVGLCQFGANGMGRQGVAYEEIIRHYYTGVDLSPAPSLADARSRSARPRMAATGSGQEQAGE